MHRQPDLSLVDIMALAVEAQGPRCGLVGIQRGDTGQERENSREAGRAVEHGVAVWELLGSGGRGRGRLGGVQMIKHGADVNMK